MVEEGEDFAVFETECGKGTYVRAIARDLGRLLGCYGHISALRRTRVGPFTETDAIPLHEVAEAPQAAMRTIESGLAEVPCIVVDRSNAARLRRGQNILLRGRDAPASGTAYASCGGVVIATGLIEGGEMLPHRVFTTEF